MDWITNNLQILATLGSALGVYVFLKNSNKKEFQEINSKLDRMEIDLKSIDRRLTYLEGAFNERGYWESRKTGTDEKK